MDYYKLLEDGPRNLSSSDWEDVVRSVLLHQGPEFDPHLAIETVQNLLFESCGEWPDRRTRILNGAEKNSSNPRRRSEYCLTSLRNLVNDTAQEAARRDASPELVLVHRQVADHLRALRDKRVLLGIRLRTKLGKDICVIWALIEWGPEARKRQPSKELEEAREELPVIVAYRGGKGIFEYAEVLPSYIPQILDTYGAPLSTAQISFTVVSRISPPLAGNPDGPSDVTDEDMHAGYGFAGWTRMPTPEDLLTERELREVFLNSLERRERRILELKEEGMSIKDIVLQVDCSERTVNNLWKSVLEKCASFLSTQ